ncbi:trigger factor [Mesorhizobium sp. NBSH29]|uniref:trigger factor n=1 Tax=Mesorhizobium sp. NBSH29 TaxID=2654249 RepID=UPI0018966BC8|nr:trigger factor [Mesorhizobium sp. NBSH29]QPC87576.1 trigger factor [Mesorhizobium sp. NBSH29]
MQVTETLNSGLKREIKVIVPASDLEAKLVARLSDAKGKARINGFRPGKVPMQHMRKMYGKSFMAEVVNEILTSSTREILAERGEKSAMQPEVVMTEDEKEAEKILAGGVDFEFKLNYEVIPAIEIKDFSGVSVTRQVYDVPEADIEEQVRKVTADAREYEVKQGKADLWDKVTINYLGKVDGEPFDGGTAEGSDLILGSGQFIPGFEEQLVGLKAGDEKVISVKFPDAYQAAHLAGKDATFDVKVNEVSKPDSTEVNDEIAKKLGVESADRLREIIRGQIESQFGQMTRQKVKRELLDALDGTYQFDAPSNLVEAEFDNIWNQVNRDLQEAGRSFADEETTEEEARAEYRRLAERRVRLGLVLAEIGEKAKVQISDEEMQRALFETVRRFPGNQQQEIFEFYRGNPQALSSIRAPLFEEKVVDHLLTQISVTDKKVSKEELLADDEPAEGAAKAKKAAPKKKAEPKAKAETSDDAEPKKAAPKKKAAAKDAE